MTKKLVIASRNSHKVNELKSVIKGFQLLSSLDYPDMDDVVEDAPTLEGNAMKKARYTFQKTGLPSIADDTGLEVQALGGRPGVFSARYAGEKATYADNIKKLLQDLTPYIDLYERKARFRTVIVYVDNEHEFVAEGIIDGYITLEPAGTAGFGYDPVFLPIGYGSTFAEMPAEMKNSISHRARAVSQIQQMLVNLF